MPRQDSLKKILPQLAKLIENTGEYLSHQTALFLLGFIKEPGEPLTIVSARRRRNRNLDGHEIVFVYHSNFDCKNVQKIDVSGEQLTISTIEKTLVDITKDQNYAPEFDKVAGLFCTMPYNLKHLLNIAKTTSDTVLKRVSLFLAWSGRAAYHDLPFKFFKRTPIKLDCREEKDLLWNSLFYCKLPERLLKTPVKEPPQDIDEEVRNWMELKALPEFCEKQFAAEMIFIRHTPEPRINQIIENFFIDIFKSLTTERLESFLTGFNKTESFPPSVPPLLRTFLNSRNDVLLLRKEDLTIWVKTNLKSNNPEKIEAAIFYGLKLGLEKEVFATFSRCCSEIFYAGKFRIINYFAKHFLNSSFKLEPKMLLNITKTWSMQEKYNPALEILEKAKSEADQAGASFSIMGQLHFATGLVYNRMEHADDALAELFLARESFNIAGNLEELARSENSLGNLYFSRGHPNSAKAHYVAGMQIARSLSSKALQSSFLANLGMVEYDLGRFSRATSYLTQSYKMNNMLKNHWTASVVGMALGKLQLKLGHFSKAMRIFREILPIRQEKGNTSGIYEISCILAWICEIIGKTATARTYWYQAENFDIEMLEPRARFVGSILQGLNHFYHGRFTQAESCFALMYDTATARNASDIQKADCMHGLAVSKFFLGKKEEALELFKKAVAALGKTKSRLQFMQIAFVAALLFPKHFTEINFEKAADTLLGCNVYDPLWVHYAQHLIDLNTDKSRDFLRRHLEHTPPSTLKALQKRFSNLKQTIKIIQKQTHRAGEFVTFMSKTETQTIHQDDYQIWQKNYPQDKLVFDGPAGLLIYNESRARLKPGSIPHSILQQLFLAHPHPIEIESLYKSVWGMEFDPEYDFGAVKSSLQRLKMNLKKVATTATLQRKRNQKGIKAVRLSVSVPWLLVFR